MTYRVAGVVRGDVDVDRDDLAWGVRLDVGQVVRELQCMVGGEIGLRQRQHSSRSRCNTSEENPQQTIF